MSKIVEDLAVEGKAHYKRSSIGTNCVCKNVGVEVVVGIFSSCGATAKAMLSSSSWRALVEKKTRIRGWTPLKLDCTSNLSLETLKPQVEKGYIRANESY